MTYYIENIDKRNSFVYKNLIHKKIKAIPFKELEFLKNCKKNDFVIFAPNKKFTDLELSLLPKNINIVCGNLTEIAKKVFETNNIKHFNLMQNEVFSYKNSNLTAEGILAKILQYSEKSIYDNKILILGMGRVGKATALLFNKMNLNFCTVSHDEKNYTLSHIFNGKHFFKDEFIKFLPDFDIIINTIPDKIIDEKNYGLIKENCLFLEIASKESLVANRIKNFTYLLCPALPTKFSCETAGKFMFEAIENMLNLNLL